MYEKKGDEAEGKLFFFYLSFFSFVHFSSLFLSLSAFLVILLERKPSRG